jgi:hypothetical protein
VPWSRKRGSIHSLPHTPLWHSAELVRYRVNFTFILLQSEVRTRGINKDWNLTKYTLTTKAIEALGLQNKQK